MTSVKISFTDEDKRLIIVLRQNKRYSCDRFLRYFFNRNWTRRGLDELIKKIDSSGSVMRAAGSGRVHTVCSDEAVAEVADLIQSQEDQPRTHLSVRQIVREVGMSRTSFHRVFTSNLKLKVSEEVMCTGADRSQLISKTGMSALVAEEIPTTGCRVHLGFQTRNYLPLLLHQICRMIGCTSSLR
jgi:AraC-like DNA-binding protein